MKRYLRAGVVLAGLLGLSLIAHAQQGPTYGTVTQVTVSCTASSTTLLAAGLAKAFARIVVPNQAANSVWFNWAGAAATTATPSDEIKAGGNIVWEYASGFMPQGPFTCIATAPTNVTLIYK